MLHIIILTGGDFKLLYLFTQKQMITVSSKPCGCIAERPSAVAALCQCWCLHLTWTSSPVSSHPDLARAHGQSNVSFCVFCGLPSGNSITNVSSLVSVNRSYIKNPQKMPHGHLYTLLHMHIHASKIVTTHLQLFCSI